MSGIFDGMAGLLADTFGSSVVLRDAAGTARTVQAVFREVPIDEDLGDGRMQVSVVPVLRVTRTAASGIRKGDWLTLPDGRAFRVLRPIPSPSPAADAFVAFEMEVHK